MEKIEIKISRKKTVGALISALFFVALGLFLMLKPDTGEEIYGGTTASTLIGLASFVFFGAFVWIWMRQLFRGGVGVVIDDHGIRDTSNAAAAGLIEWSDVTETKIRVLGNVKILLIYTTDPDKYISRTKGMGRNNMKHVQKKFGTPVFLSGQFFKCDLGAVRDAIDKELEQRKQQTSL